ncbi:MAG: hypothetical protein AB2462_11785 [Thermoanaerobacter sp.]
MLNKRVKIYISIIIALGLSFIIYSILNIPINDYPTKSIGSK